MSHLVRLVGTARRSIALALAVALVAVLGACSADEKKSGAQKPGSGLGGAAPVSVQDPGTTEENLDTLIATAPRIDASCDLVTGITRRLVRAKDALAAGRTLAARSLLAATIGTTEDQVDAAMIPSGQGDPMQTAAKSVLAEVPGAAYESVAGDDTSADQFNQAIAAMHDNDQSQSAQATVPPTVDSVCPSGDTRPPLTKTATDDIGIVIAHLLDEIPEVGGILSAIVEILWPEDEHDVWEDIEGRVEALVNQKIAENVAQQVDLDLKGLDNVLADYTKTVQGDPDNGEQIRAKFNAAQSAFELMSPHFAAPGYEAPLLGAYAQMTNLYLGLLRDGVLFGKQWGLSDNAVKLIQEQLTKLIATSTAYAQKTFQDHVPVKNPRPRNLTDWRRNNTYNRDMNLIVLDSAAVWPYMDPAKYPKPPTVNITRTVYSEPFGCVDDGSWDPETEFTIDPPPSQPLTNVTVWGWDRIDAMMVSYGGNRGPRMGNETGGSSDLPHGMGAEIGPDGHGPVTAVYGRAGAINDAAGFLFGANGKDHPAWDSGMLGGLAHGGNPYSWSLDNETLTYLKVQAGSPHYNGANCLVYGWRYPQK